jgi:PAS domain S-box-containing protein
MFSEDTVLELIGLIYAAAGDPAQWTTLLERLAAALQGTVATIHHQDNSSQESNFSTLWNIDPDAIVPYTAYYGARNPLMTTQPNRIQAGAVNTLEMLCPEKTFVRSEYYNDYLRRLDLLHCMAATLRNDGLNSSNVSIFRSPRGEPFEEEERKFLLLLSPHLQRAFQLHTRIHGLERKAGAAGDALDQVPQAVVMFGANGKVLMVNRAASALFGIEPTLRLTPQGLVAAVPSENKRLNQLIQGVLKTGSSKGFHSGGGMTISRKGSRRPLHVLVTPLRTRTIHLGKDVPIAAVFISDPERKPVSESQAISQLYGLTAAESRLVVALASGQTLKDAADQFGVTQSTLRSQLKSIFGKTNTNSQSQLVRLIMLTPPYAPRGIPPDGNVLD